MSQTWFVVTRRAGRDSPAVYHDYLPPWITGKHAQRLGVRHVEQLSLDRCTLPLQTLWAEYRRDKAYREANEKHPLPVSGTAEVVEGG